MIRRESEIELAELLDEFPVVALLGPRQVGKTTLAEHLAGIYKGETLYLDLETPSDLVKLTDAEAFFELHKGTLIILDEIQRVPELFVVLRGVIDRRRKEGLRAGQFLILGSASLELLKQSSETLAGRIAYRELTGILASEFSDINTLWLRGGFPDSLLAKSDIASFRWRQNFISTYLERDIPQIGPRIPAITLRRLWTMLAHNQGTMLNQSVLAGSLGVTVPTVKRYIELLEDLFLLRSLRPWSGNLGKRLVKTPKTYIRDSGLTHALLNIRKFDDVLAHPVAGGSWEGFVIENLIASLNDGDAYWFYRTSAGAEIDFVIERGPEEVWAIEIKRSTAPVVSTGFYIGCKDVKATRKFVVYPGHESYPAGEGIMVVPLGKMMEELQFFRQDFTLQI